MAFTEKGAQPLHPHWGGAPHANGDKQAQNNNNNNHNNHFNLHNVVHAKPRAHARN